MQISFDAKVRTMHNVDDTVAYRYIQVPVLKRSHVDMAAARRHPKFGAYANSDLFLGMLAALRRRRFPSGMVRLDEIPEGVTVDESKFLANVSWSES